ncbi:MAG: hypothetical protein ACQEXJ_10315 [Myxococcota bacterium]
MGIWRGKVWSVVRLMAAIAVVGPGCGGDGGGEEAPIGDGDRPEMQGR